MPDFSKMPEAFVSNADLATAVSREVKAGRLRKLGSRLYTRNLNDPPEKIVQRNLWLLVPTVYRNNYLMALKALSQNGVTGALVRVMDFAQRYTAAIDFSDFERARSVLEKTHAFVDPNEADTAGIRLILPTPEAVADAPKQ